MPNLAWKLDGFSQLDAALVDLGPKVANQIARRGMKAGCEVIAAGARGRCPRSGEDHPHLADSIVVIVKHPDGSAQREALIGFLQPASRHAGFVEFGRAGQAAHPFMRPSLDANGGTAIEIMGEIMGEDIEAAANGYPLGRL